VAPSVLPLLVVVAAVAAAAIVVVVRFEEFCLQDLAQTPDYELRLFTRRGWTALIVVWIPIGGLLYLSVGKWR
jgi:hypothetical protein